MSLKSRMIDLTSNHDIPRLCSETLRQYYIRNKIRYRKPSLYYQKKFLAEKAILEQQQTKSEYIASHL